MVMVNVYGKLEDLGVLPDRLDPEEGIRTVRYGSDANLGSA